MPPEHHLSQIQSIDPILLPDQSVSLSILREDEIHPFVSGNKFRKLKYPLQEALEQARPRILTFGGAYSNHIAAVAHAGFECRIPTVGVIRGEELATKEVLNPTLQFARERGMQLHFVNREAYRRKTSGEFLDVLRNQFGDFYLIPEGGTNPLAVQGCREILNSATSEFDVLCVPVGTGGTLSGMVLASEAHQQLIGFSALKGVFQHSEIKKHTARANFKLTDAYCLGGYGKIDSKLVRFINGFKRNTGIPLDPVYTGKMMYGIMDMIANRQFKENSRILAVHTGGLQGIVGMNERLKRKDLPQIV